MALRLSLAPPAAAPAAATCRCSSASFLRPQRSRRPRGCVVATADLLGDLGARDPFPEEIESQFGEKVLGNVDTLHHILIPTLSALSLASLPLRPNTEMEDPPVFASASASMPPAAMEVEADDVDEICDSAAMAGRGPRWQGGTPGREGAAMAALAAGAGAIAGGQRRRIYPRARGLNWQLRKI